MMKRAAGLYNAIPNDFLLFYKLTATKIISYTNEINDIMYIFWQNATLTYGLSVNILLKGL